MEWTDLMAAFIFGIVIGLLLGFRLGGRQQ